MTEKEAFERAEITFRENDTTHRVPLRAPYMFVPAGEKVLDAPKAPRHDRPLPDAVSGRLKVTLTAETPILVGGTGKENDANNSPARAPDGRWIVPGTSVRGMVRAVLESAAFARMSFVDDCATATRDFKDPTWISNVAAHDEIDHSGGWLFITSEGWKLVPAGNTEKVHFNEVLGWVGESEGAWHGMNMHARLNRMQAKGLLGRVDAEEKFGRTGQARLVVAGPTADAGRKGNKRKRHEYLFFWPDVPDAKPIDQRTGERFVASLYMHTNPNTGVPEANYSALVEDGRAAGFDANWQAWKRNRKNEVPTLAEQIGNPDCWALPVFWRNRKAGDNGNAQKQPQPDPQRDPQENPNPILSLTAFLKVPYERSLTEVIASTGPKAAGDAYDLVQALFGWAAPEVEAGTAIGARGQQERALRSRVRFGFLFSESKAEETDLIDKTWAATRPHASFWPYYLRPKDDQATHPVDFDNDKAMVAGRKRYPARGAAQSLPAVSADEESADRRNSTLHFLPPGTAFTGQIRLHNVTPVELGGLIWALTFGQIGADGAFSDQGYRHMLGRARSWGYGQVKLEIAENALAPVVGEGGVDIAGAVEAFKDWVCGEVGAGCFEEIETIRRLLNASHAETGGALNGRLRFPAVDAQDGDAENIVKGYTQIRKKAQEKGPHERRGVKYPASPAPRAADSGDFVGLPPYPEAS